MQKTYIWGERLQEAGSGQPAKHSPTTAASDPRPKHVEKWALTTDLPSQTVEWASTRTTATGAHIYRDPVLDQALFCAEASHYHTTKWMPLLAAFYRWRKWRSEFSVTSHSLGRGEYRTRFLTHFFSFENLKASRAPWLPRTAVGEVLGRGVPARHFSSLLVIKPTGTMFSQLERQERQSSGRQNKLYRYTPQWRALRGFESGPILLFSLCS